MRYALIQAQIVYNIIVWDGVTDLGLGPDQIAVQSDTAQIGDSYVNGVFIPYVPPPPMILTIDSASNAITALNVRVGPEISGLIGVAAGAIPSTTVVAQAGDPLWHPFVDQREKLWTVFDSAVLPDGPVASWRDLIFGTLATQTDPTKQPVKSAAADAVLFSSLPQFLNWPNQSRTGRHYRSMIVEYWVDLLHAPAQTGTLICANGYAGGLRSPMLGYDGVAKSCSAQWSGLSTINFTPGPFTKKQLLIVRRVNGVNKVSINAGPEVSDGTNVLVPRDFANQLSILGDFRVPGCPWALKRVFFCQEEMSDEELLYWQGWGMWDLGNELDLPTDHRFHNGPPTSKPWVNPTPIISDQDFINAQSAWWADNSKLKMGFGQSIDSFINALPQVFSHDTSSLDSLGEETAAPGGIITMFSPSQDALLGTAIQRSPSQLPSVYSEDPLGQLISMQQVNGAGNWYSGIFCTVNIDGRGETWDPSLGPVYFEWDGWFVPGNGHGGWTGFWLKDAQEYRNGYTNRIEIDASETYEGDPNSTHGTVHLWNGERPYAGRYFGHDYRSHQARFTTGTLWPEGVQNLWDGQRRKYGVYIDRDWLIFSMNRIETHRCPSMANMMQPLYALVSLYMNGDEQAQAAGVHGMGLSAFNVWQGSYGDSDSIAGLLTQDGRRLVRES